MPDRPPVSRHFDTGMQDYTSAYAADAAYNAAYAAYNAAYAADAAATAAWETFDPPGLLARLIDVTGDDDA